MRKALYEELHGLYRSSNVVRVIKSKILRLGGHPVRKEEGRSAFKILTSKENTSNDWAQTRCYI